MFVNSNICCIILKVCLSENENVIIPRGSFIRKKKGAPYSENQWFVKSENEKGWSFRRFVSPKVKQRIH